MAETGAELKGLAAVERLYDDYGYRARELKAQGAHVVGYLCAFVPLEVLTAAGVVPIRIKGDAREPIARADAEMERIVCSLVRSCFDACLRGKYDFLDGLVLPHSCDSVSCTYSVWKERLGLPYCHFLNVPHTTSAPSMEFFGTLIRLFAKSIGSFGGAEVTDAKLAEAIRLHNRNRALMRQLYELRKSDPPLLSGVEMTKILVAAMSLPVAECNLLLGNVLQEVTTRGARGVKALTRVMIIGAQIDDIALFRTIEDSGASVVVDDTCIGTRVYGTDADPDKAPVEALAERYLVNVMCPRTYREKTGTQQEYEEARFGHIGRLIREFDVGGVILVTYKYCDPYGFEVPAIKKYVKAAGLPVLWLEEEYPIAGAGRLGTRVQAFLEMAQGMAAKRTP